MYVELEKKDIIALIKGSSPSLDLVIHLEKRGLCTYSDQYGRLSWDDSELNKLSELDLLKLYNQIKKS